MTFKTAINYSCNVEALPVYGSQAKEAYFVLNHLVCRVFLENNLFVMLRRLKVLPQIQNLYKTMMLPNLHYCD